MAARQAVLVIILIFMPISLQVLDASISEISGIGSRCQEAKDCAVGLGLNCYNGTCSCHPVTEVFNRFPSFTRHFEEVVTVPANHCLQRVGQSCDFDISSISSSNPYCVRGAKCNLKKVCECMESFKRTKYNLCATGYDKECAVGLPCQGKLRCVNGRCACPNPDFQVFDEEFKVCRNFLGARCEDTGGNETRIVCINHASCVQGRCDCESGYVQVNPQTCHKAFGESCQHEEKDCDGLAGLKCVEGKCLCPNEISVFEPDSRYCGIPVGYSCKKDAECVEKAECKFAVNGGETGTCQCVSGYRQGTYTDTCVFNMG